MIKRLSLPADAVFDKLKHEYPDRLICLEGKYDQNEIKGIIGQCDFFTGSRMHACIAAASQGIPVVPLAYSKKFRGVFEVLDQSEQVIDLRENGIDTISQIADRLEQREMLKQNSCAVSIDRVEHLFEQMQI